MKRKITHSSVDFRGFIKCCRYGRLSFSGISSLQVLTRFLSSSSPVPFWVSAQLLILNEPLLRRSTSSSSKRQQQYRAANSTSSRSLAPHNPILALMPHWRTCSPTTQCIVGYYISYWLLGLALHCNFLPWTWITALHWTLLPFLYKLGVTLFSRLWRGHAVVTIRMYFEEECHIIVFIH